MSTTTADAFAERLFHAALGAVDLFTIYLGDQLGLYRALRTGPATPKELAARAGTDQRYTREWLEQQAVSGILTVDDPAAGADERRYSLPEAHAEVLTEPTSLTSMSWMSRFMSGVGQKMPELLAAYRHGGGVAWQDYGPDAIEAQGDQNRPVFTHLLAEEWLPSITDVHERLTAGGARVADIACGVGWSAIAIAAGYPQAHVDGFDLDERSIELANENARAAGVSDRVRFEVRDAGDDALAGRYDLVTMFEALHDLPRPVEALGAMRRLAAEGGAVLVMDERVAESFTAPGDEVERMMYGYSTLICLPASRIETPSAALGTVLRPGAMRALAAEAGFTRTDVLEIEHDFFRFYRLFP